MGQGGGPSRWKIESYRSLRRRDFGSHPPPWLFVLRFESSFLPLPSPRKCGLWWTRRTSQLGRCTRKMGTS
jgi:hypothetical protein